MKKLAELKTIIVTGGDAKYFPYIVGLIASIKRLNLKSTSVGVIDGGFLAEQKEKLLAGNIKVIKPKWDSNYLKLKASMKEYLLVNLYKSRLDELFPDYDIIIWLDGDTWLQTDRAITYLKQVALSGKLAVVSQASRLQQQHMALRKKWFWLAEPRSILFKNARRANLSKKLCWSLAARPTLNAGVYALLKDAPHWQVWKNWQEKCRKRGRLFSSDQLSMALTIYHDGLPFEALPNICNYMGPWRYDTQREVFTDLYVPYEPVSVVHLAGIEKKFGPIEKVNVITETGETLKLSLAYEDWYNKRLTRPVGS